MPSRQQLKQLQLALINAFPSRALLERLLYFELEKNLNEITRESDLQEIVFKLIQAAESQGWLIDLVHAAYKENSGNLLLQPIAQELLIRETPQTPSPNIHQEPNNQDLLHSARQFSEALSLKVYDVIAPHKSVLEKSIEDAEGSKQALLDEIKSKEEEIECLRQKGSLYESDITKLLAEKSDLEICVQRLDESLEMLKTLVTDFDQRMKDSREGADWLNERRQKALARESAEYLFSKHLEIIKTDGGLDSAFQVKRFAKDIRKYLYLIHHCLDLGSYNLLYKAMVEPTIPFTMEPAAYVVALRFIKDQKISQDMPSTVARELKFYLDCLIKLIEPLC